MTAGATNYHSRINALTRGLWGGVFDYYQFFEQMERVVQVGLTTAWYEGAKECGILPADLSPSERAKLRQAIAHEINRIDGFATTIEENSRANGGKIGPLLMRAKAWILRYQDVVNHAKVLACEDQKLEWVHQAFGATKDPCPTCKDKLNGKIKRASYWRDRGIRPQNPPNPYLICEGWG